MKPFMVHFCSTLMSSPPPYCLLQKTIVRTEKDFKANSEGAF